MRGAVVVLVSALLTLRAVGRALPARRILTGGTKFNYQRSGTDWPEDFHDCAGFQQSPINVDTAAATSDSRDLTARIISFGEGENVKVVNEGQAVKVTWEESRAPTILVPVVEGKVSGAIDPVNTAAGPFTGSTTATFTYAAVRFGQFHFHISSENAVDGVLFPMEAHLVGVVPKEEIPSCGDSGCVVVFSTLFKITERDNDFLEPIFAAIPERAGEEFEEELPADFQLFLDDLVPKIEGFYTWDGSFTTPPCTEGVTWIMFDTFQTLSSRQLTMLQTKMAAVRSTCQGVAKKAMNLEALEECNYIGDLKNNRQIQDLGSRVVTHVAGFRYAEQ